MFLKNANSITAKLTLFYTVASFILVGGITIFLYWAMVNVLHQNDRQFLLDEIQIVQYLLERNDTNTLQHEIVLVPIALKNSIYHYSIRILDPNNKIIMDTPGMKDSLYGARTVFKQAKDDVVQGKWWTAKNGDVYLLLQSSVKLSNQDWTIQAALDISDQHIMIVKYRERALKVLITGVLFSLLIGYVIAKKGLRRLDELTETTKNITTLSLHQRINSKHWPKELRKLGRSFNDMLNRIEVSFSQLTQFSDDLAHELRNPIHNLINETEVVLAKTHSLQDYRQVLELNLEEFQRIYHIIENILFLARTENPQLNLSKERLDVNKEIAVICDFYQAMAEDKNITITCEGGGRMWANQVMFRRMISNILSNAIKYTEKNGSVHFHVNETPSEIVICLKDTGMGIDAKHIDKIFNRFYRVDSSRTDHGSVGLGLAIVKSIAALHQGMVSISSQLGRGTEISIVFAK